MAEKVKRRRVAILLFDDVEVLDFAGPFEVFSVTAWRREVPPFEVFTLAQTRAPVIARNGLSINPHYALDNCPELDILLVPGGFGTRREIDNPRLVGWIAAAAQRAELTLSVCTGALLLAKANLLNGLDATTHQMGFELLEQLAPGARIRREKRIADNGRIVLSAGVSAGIDMALHVVARLEGIDCARETAAYMEYDWNETADP